MCVVLSTLEAERVKDSMDIYELLAKVGIKGVSVFWVISDNSLQYLSVL